MLEHEDTTKKAALEQQIGGIYGGDPQLVGRLKVALVEVLRNYKPVGQRPDIETVTNREASEVNLDEIVEMWNKNGGRFGKVERDVLESKGWRCMRSNSDYIFAESGDKSVVIIIPPGGWAGSELGWTYRVMVNGRELTKAELGSYKHSTTKLKTLATLNRDNYFEEVKPKDESIFESGRGSALSNAGYLDLVLSQASENPAIFNKGEIEARQV